MALFINQESNRTKLQERLATELNEKAKKKALLEKKDIPDGVDDSNYLKNTRTTTSFAWVWIVIILIAIAAAITLIINPSV